MPRYSKVKLILHCRTCDKKLHLTVHYGDTNIWNNTSASQLADWYEHQAHDTHLTYEFTIGDKDMRTYKTLSDIPS